MRTNSPGPTFNLQGRLKGSVRICTDDSRYIEIETYECNGKFWNITYKHLGNDVYNINLTKESSPIVDPSTVMELIDGK